MMLLESQWPFLPFSLSIASVLIAAASLRVNATNETHVPRRCEIGVRSLHSQ